MVGQRNFARPGFGTAAHQGGAARRVVGRAEAPHAPVAEVEPGLADRGDRGGIQRLPFGQRRQNAGQPARQHRLAGARRSAKQDVVPTGRRHLQRSPCEMLPIDIRKVPGGVGHAIRSGPAFFDPGLGQ